ncbi:hypothetical protein KI387_025935, partial [Taxus chinensis]
MDLLEGRMTSMSSVVLVLQNEKGEIARDELESIAVDIPEKVEQALTEWQALEAGIKEEEEFIFTLQGGEDQSPLLYKNDFSAGLIELSILKMDNTSFDIRVSRRASVRELKQAVQREFGASQGEEEGKISWGHVWGNFCLTYQAHKLVDDSSLLSSFGIKDSDQLCFIRHFSSANQGEKLRPRKHGRFPPFRR